MAVEWWVLTNNRLMRHLLKYARPLGIRSFDCLLYKGNVSDIIDIGGSQVSNADIQPLGPANRDAAREFREKYGLSIEGCPEPQVMLAMKDGVVIGHTCYRADAVYIDELEREELFDGIYFSHLFISPEARRGGIGRALTIRSIKMAEEHGHSGSVYLYIERHNLPSRRLFESLGCEAARRVHYLRLLNMRRWVSEMPLGTEDGEPRRPDRLPNL